MLDNSEIDTKKINGIENRISSDVKRVNILLKSGERRCLRKEYSKFKREKGKTIIKRKAHSNI